MAQPTILQMLEQSSPAMGGIAQIKATVDKLRALKNPQEAAQMILRQKNPGMTKAIEYVKQHGNDPKAAFEALARERGLDPAEISAQLGL